MRTYKCNLDDFFQTVNKPLNQITTNDIRVYLFGLSAKGNTNRTIDGKRLIIHTFLDWCVKEEYLTKNVCSRINPIKFEAKPREPLSDIELELVRDACKDYREKALVELFYSTGCRVSEMVILKKLTLTFGLRKSICSGKVANTGYHISTPEPKLL